MKQNKLTEYEYLEWARVLLENAIAQTEVAESLSNVGYTSEIIAEGTQKYQNAYHEFQYNRVEDDQTRQTRTFYNEKLHELEIYFKPLRTKAKVIFRNDSQVQIELMIVGSFPNSYPTLIERTEKFFNTLNANPELLAKLSRLAVTQEQILTGLDLIAQLKQVRAQYQIEIGESQESTKSKDQALKELEDWIIDFKEVAGLALEHKPQLQESLGIFIRS